MASNVQHPIDTRSGASFFANAITSVLTKALKDAAHTGRRSETGKLSY